MATTDIFTLTIELGRNVAFLLALTFTYCLFRPSLERLSTNVQAGIDGFLFGLFAIAVMLTPIQLGAGLLLDGRIIMLAIAGAFRGWRTAAIATTMVILYRLAIGGDGAPAAIGSALTSTLFGVWLFWRSGGIVTAFTTRLLFQLGIALALQRLLWTLVLSPTTAISILQVVVLPVMVFVPLGTVLLGQLFVNEQRRVETERALNVSEERYRRITEQAHDLIYRYRLVPERRFEYINPAALTLTGYSPEEFYQDPYLTDKIIHPDDKILLQQARAGNKQPQTIIFRCVRKDGHVIWLEQRTVPVLDEVGNLIAIEGIVRDLSHVQQVKEKG